MSDGSRLGRVRTAAQHGGKRCKRGVVQVITSEKVIQAFLTGSVTGAVVSFFEGTAVIATGAVQGVFGVFIPAKWILAVFLLFVFYAAYWADNHTEEFRELVEEATGEEAAQDDTTTAQ